MGRVRRLALAAGFGAICWLTTGGPLAAESLSREQALAALANHEDAVARRQGAGALGETGVMADVPALTQALRDPDDDVRTLAEQSL